ncbi:MAG TPA: hypothetical protein VE338_17400 [Ktedonobacterales bacterium]|nr:hypothetical protein [Ktedonobacterales bacterium]
MASDGGSEHERQLDQLVTAVHASARYRAVAEPLVRSLGERELAKRRGLKEAIKAT